MGRKAGCDLSVSGLQKPVAQISPRFAPDRPRRQGDDEVRGRASHAGVLATGTAASACHRPAAASLACQPDSGHPGQSKQNEVRLDEFVRLCPQSPAASCQAAFDFHPASSSHALRSGRAIGKIPKGVVTPPFLLKNEITDTMLNSFKSRMFKGFKAVFASLENCFAVTQRSWGAL